MWTRLKELNNEFKNIKEQKEKDKKIYKTIIKTDPQKWKKIWEGYHLWNIVVHHDWPTKKKFPLKMVYNGWKNLIFAGGR